MSLIGDILDRVSGNEGTYGSLNLNTDKAGLSVGRIQWSQATGMLGQLVSAWAKADPNAFVAFFGAADSTDLIITLTRSTERERMAPVGGAVLWAEPWVSRFKAATAHRPFQTLQDELMAGDTWQGALDAARATGVRSERALTLLYDRAVQQGPDFVRGLASRIAAAHAGQKFAELDLLGLIADAAPAHFRSTTPKSGNYSKNGRLVWAAVGSEWHVFAGRVDLYKDCLRRATSILKDPTLSDAPSGVV